MRVNFDDKERYKYVLDLLAIQKANPFNIQAYEQFLDGENQDLMVLLDRFNRNAPTVLPFFREKHNDIVWLVVSEDRQEFIQCAEEVRSFITPVWAEIYPFNDTSSFPYHSDAFFPYGLKMFKSPMRLSNSTIKLLYRWTKLRDMKPVFSPEEGKTNIYLLRSQFQEAVALNRWDEANSFLGIIRQGHYLSDENCVFLEFQLLSAQQHWEILWNHKNYVLATGLDPLPAKVRQVLLTAFCQVILLPVANDSDKMISEYRINCYRLGTLLSYKAGLQDDSQLLVFVLDAVCEGDKNRFDNLVNKLRDEYYISVAERLRTKLPANLPENTPNLYHLCEEGTSLEKAKLALSERLYDDAFIYTLDCARGIIRIQLLLSLAKLTEDKDICTQARLEYGELSMNEQKELLAHPVDQQSIQWVLGLKPDKIDPAQNIKLPLSWLEWFLMIEAGQNLSDLIDNYLEFLKRTDLLPTKNQDWANLQELLMRLVLNDDSIDVKSKQLLRISILEFIQQLTSCDDYPSTLFRDLYEYLLYGIRRFCSPNVNSLGFQRRLVEGLLSLDPFSAERLGQEAYSENNVIPSLQLSGEILAFVELFNEYGVISNFIIDWWTRWVSSLVGIYPRNRGTELESWLYCGECLNCDEYLLEQIRNRLANPILIDPLVYLGTRKVVIFSLRVQAAERAASRIMKRNPNLQVLVCSEEDLNSSVKHHAASADLSVVVTACLSHSLYYGIMPYLKISPLYPRDAGETGIVQIVEEYALGLLKEEKIS